MRFRHWGTPAPAFAPSGFHVHYHLVETITITYRIEIDAWS